jgi:hypothetical protein
MLRFHYTSLIIIIFLLSGCGQTNYLLKSDTPPILEGFYGFRWTTPMSIVDEEFPKKTNAKPIDSLNRYNNSNFIDAYFLGELTSLCLFGFNETGLTSVNILFNTDYQTFEYKLYYLEEKLSAVYGERVEVIGNPYDRESAQYFNQLIWAQGRLKLTLLTDYKLEITALGYNPIRIFRNN